MLQLLQIAFPCTNYQIIICLENMSCKASSTAHCQDFPNLMTLHRRVIHPFIHFAMVVDAISGAEHAESFQIPLCPCSCSFLWALPKSESWKKKPSLLPHIVRMCVLHHLMYDCCTYVCLFGDKGGNHKATTACSPDKGVGTPLLFRGRLVSDCDPSPSLLLLPLFSPLMPSFLSFHHHRGKKDGAFRLPEVKRTRWV